MTASREPVYMSRELSAKARMTLVDAESTTRRVTAGAGEGPDRLTVVQAEVALLRRVRMTVADAASARCEVALDGWPLLLVDRIGGCVRVNDVRSAAMFSHGVRLPSEAERLTVRAGAVGDELFVLVGEAVAVYSVLGRARCPKTTPR